MKIVIPSVCDGDLIICLELDKFGSILELEDAFALSPELVLDLLIRHSSLAILVCY